MKDLLHYILILTVLALTMVGLQSCSSDDLHNEDDAQVCFTVSLPADTHTRSFGKAEQVNTLVVGIFNEQKSEVGRKKMAITGSSIDVNFSLAQNQTYSFVFWAYDSSLNIYNIDNLTAIEMNSLPNAVTFAQAEAMDAFFAIEKDITITKNSSHTVELIRPLAQINVGTTAAQIQATFKAKSVPNTFYPFTNTVSGAADYTWKFNETTAETFTTEYKQYKYLALGYVFAPTVATNISAELTLTDGINNKTLEFPQIKIEANQRTNIAGNFTATN